MFARRASRRRDASISRADARTWAGNRWRRQSSARFPARVPTPSSRRHARHGPAASHLLLDLEVRIAARGNLREVRDAQDLMAARQRLQPGADRVGRCPADARVHLVEHQRRVARSSDAAIVRSASMTRDSSPPEAIRARGRSSSPGSATGRTPRRRCRAPSMQPHRAIGRTRISTRHCGIASSASSAAERARERAAGRQAAADRSRAACEKRRRRVRRAPRSSSAARSLARVERVELLAQRRLTRAHVGQRRARASSSGARAPPADPRPPAAARATPRCPPRTTGRKNARSSRRALHLVTLVQVRARIGSSSARSATRFHTPASAAERRVLALVSAAYASADRRLSRSALASTTRVRRDRLVLARPRRRRGRSPAAESRPARSARASPARRAASDRARSRRHARPHAVANRGDRAPHVPAKASSRPTCSAGSSSAWCSCWPCRSTSRAPKSRSAAVVASASSMNARLRPCAETSRRTMTRARRRARRWPAPSRRPRRCARGRRSRARRPAGRAPRRASTCRRRSRRSGRSGRARTRSRAGRSPPGGVLPRKRSMSRPELPSYQILTAFWRLRVTLSAFALFPAAPEHDAWRCCCATLGTLVCRAGGRPDPRRDPVAPDTDIVSLVAHAGSPFRSCWRFCCCSRRSRGASSSSSTCSSGARRRRPRLSRRLPQEQPVLRSAGSLRDVCTASPLVGLFQAGYAELNAQLRGQPADEPSRAPRRRVQL